MGLHGWSAVSRRTLVQKQQRILDVECIGVENFVEEVIGILKLRCEFVTEFLPDLEATTVHTGTDGSHDVFR